MITQIEAFNYRCLQYISKSLGSFHVLVGPNASGKTTFLDVLGFLRDMVSEGLDTALSNRTSNPEELLYRRQGNHFELALEASIPDPLRELTSKPELDTIRYEVSIGFDDTHGQFEFKSEKLLLKKTGTHVPIQRSLFPMPPVIPPTILSGKNRQNKLVINKVMGGNDNFYSEIYGQAGKGWTPSIKLGPRKSALQNLPADETAMPVATWFRNYISVGVQRFILNSQHMRQPSPPTKVKGFLPDGSNLPWVVDWLKDQNKSRFESWIAHLRTALPDLMGISTIKRPEDNHRYLIYEYAGGIKVPSWLVSDGTLRLTALTLPAYLETFDGIYLVEEPENGIHPRAIETVFDSLSSVYTAQVLLASHSTVILNAAQSKDVLCFAKSEEGATDIVLGTEHPMLIGWKGETKMGTLLAAGVLG